MSEASSTPEQEKPRYTYKEKTGKVTDKDIAEMEAFYAREVKSLTREELIDPRNTRAEGAYVHSQALGSLADAKRLDHDVSPLYLSKIQKGIRLGIVMQK